MNHTEWLERAEIYALGALDGEDLAGFEAHIASGCPICERHLHETDELLTLLTRSLPVSEPPAELKDRLLARVDRKDAGPYPLRARPSWPRNLAWAGGLAAACLLIALGLNLRATRVELRDRDRRLEALEHSVESLRAELGRQETALAARDRVIEFLAVPGVKAIELKGQATTPGAGGRLFWNPETGTGVLIASGLPPAPPGKAYELWAIGKTPVPAGVFAASAAGRAIHHVPRLADAPTYSRFAVTLEPAGGSAQPTSPILLDGIL